MEEEGEMPNRTLCDVLKDMRKCVETLNFAMLLSLVEEAQILGNRMEAGLWDQKDITRLQENKRELKKEVNDLEQKAKSLKTQNNLKEDKS